MKVKYYKKKEYILSAILILLILIMLLVFFRPAKKDTSFHEPDYQISFLLHEEMNNALENMKKGADKAADDLNASVRFIPLEQGAKAATQSKHVDEELRNHTQAMIVSPDAGVKDSLPRLQIPIIFAESKIDIDKTIPYIGCDYDDIASSLADEIIRHGNFHNNILIFANKQQNDSTKQTMLRLQEHLQKVGNTVSIEYMDQVNKEHVYSILSKRDVDVAVALGQKQLEEVSMAFRRLRKEEKKGNMEVYGSGNSKAIIRDIEDGYIISTIIQDDFSTGYLSVQCAIRAIDGKPCEQRDIRFALIDKENMYNKENEWLLFPFVR